ncbi:hypothetical protein PYCC9005_004356 [Savitreella phatthalungensis]
MDSPAAAILTIDIGSIDGEYAREIGKAVLHSILFHRLFGQVSARTIEVVEVTVSCADDAKLESLIDAKADAFAQQLLATASALSAADAVSVPSTPTIVIDFFQMRKNKGVWPFTRAEEPVCWESWRVRARLLPPARSEGERDQAKEATRRALDTALWNITDTANRRNDEYLPAIPYGQDNPFPYQIAVSRQPPSTSQPYNPQLLT